MDAPMPKSLQEILRRRKHELFVGRDKELEFFSTNIALPFDDDRRRFVFHVFGQGGVGKSLLLSQFQQLAGNANYVTTKVDENQSDVPSALGHFATQLNAQGRGFGDFLEQYRKYRQSRQELEADPAAPRDLPALIGGIVGRGGISLGRHIPFAGAALDFVDRDAIGTHVGDWATFVASKLSNKNDVQLVLDPVGVLTPLFVDGIRRLIEDHHVLLIFDTFEHTADALEPWALDLLRGLFGELPPEMLIAIAGRDRPSPNRWEEFSELVARIELVPFTEEEVRGYLARKQITEDSIVRDIIQLSEGLPLLVATLASAEPGNPMGSTEPSETAIERFLKWENPERTSIALGAALPRRLNLDVISELFGEDKGEPSFAWLKSMPFVSASAEGWVYHDVVRSQMLRYVRRESPASWSDSHSRLAGYFERLTAGADRNEDQQSEGLREGFYHRLCQAPESYLSEALGLLVSRSSRAGLSKRKWAEIVIQAGKDANSDQMRSWGQRVLTADRALDDGNMEPMEAVVSAVLAHATLSDQHRAQAFDWRGFLRVMKGELHGALADIDQAVRLDATVGSFLLSRGWVYLTLGRSENARTDLARVTSSDITASDKETRLARLLLEVVAGTPQGDNPFGIAGNMIDRMVLDVDHELIDLDHEEQDRPSSEFLDVMFDQSLIGFAKVMDIPLEYMEMNQNVFRVVKQYMETMFWGDKDQRRMYLEELKAGILALREIERMLSPALSEQSSVDWVQLEPRLESVKKLGRILDGFSPKSSEGGVPNDTNSSSFTLSLVLNVGLSLSRAGKFEEALNVFRDGLEEEPDSPILLYNYAVAEVRARGLTNAQATVDAAVARLHEILATGRERVVGNYGLGGLEALMGNQDAALSFLQLAVVEGNIVVKWANTDPAWFELREDDRFKAIVHHSSE